MFGVKLLRYLTYIFWCHKLVFIVMFFIIHVICIKYTLYFILLGNFNISGYSLSNIQFKRVKYHITQIKTKAASNYNIV